MKQARICLATVTSDSFVPGTLVMLHSFLSRNPWFCGDVVLIHDGLTAESREHLAGRYPQVSFMEAGAELRERITEVTAARPDFGSKQARFLALEAFRLRGYEKVLFCDSDVLFRRQVRELFEVDDPFVACADGAKLRRKPQGYLRTDAQPCSMKSFNSGLFVVDGSLLNEHTYAGLLSFVEPQFHGPRTRHMADQVVLNFYFEGQYRLVSSSYNYLLPYHTDIYQHERIRIADAHALHFVGPSKPWRPLDALRASVNRPEFVKAIEFWSEAYVGCLKEMALPRMSMSYAH